MSGSLASTILGNFSVLTLDITNTVNPNISALLTAAGWLGKLQPVRIVNNGNVNTLDIPASIDGTDITLINPAGKLIGGLVGGGTAIKTRAHIKIDSLGSIFGGGGRGNSGGSCWATRGDGRSASASGGGAGGGQGFGAGSLTVFDATDGYPGNMSYLPPTGVFGGGGASYGPLYVYGGRGGMGGTWGNVGQNHQDRYGYADGDYSGVGSGEPTPPTPGGYYIDGNNYVTWINTGTRLGRVLA